MVHSTVINNWLAVAKDDPVEIDPDDINHEAMSNAASCGSAWCRARMGGCRFAARCAKRRIYR